MTERILCVAEFIHPGYVGGSARYAHDLLKGILELDGAPVIDLVARSPSGHYALAPSEGLASYFRRMGAASFEPLNSPAAARRCLGLSLRASFIVAHHPFAAAALFLLNRKQKLFYFFHGPLHLEYAAKSRREYGLGFRTRKLLQTLVLKRASKVIVLSDYMAAQARALCPDAQVEVIGPIVSEDFFVAPSALRAGRTDGKKHLVCVRRLTARTGVAELLDTFRKLPDDEVVLHIVGVGELEEELRARHVDDFRIRFHSYLSDEQMRNLIITADACILPSLSLEGFGLVILEAYANGVPIITTTTSGGAAAFVSAIDPGFIYDVAGGVSSLRKAIDHAISFDDRDHLVEVARTFTPKAVAAKFLSLMRASQFATGQPAVTRRSSSGTGGRRAC